METRKHRKPQFWTKAVTPSPAAAPHWRSVEPRSPAWRSRVPAAPSPRPPSQIPTSSTSPSISSTLRRSSTPWPRRASPSTLSASASPAAAARPEAPSPSSQPARLCPSRLLYCSSTRWKPPSKNATTSASCARHWQPQPWPCPTSICSTASTRSPRPPDSVRPSIPSPAKPTSCSAPSSSRTWASPPTTARPA